MKFFKIQIRLGLFNFLAMTITFLWIGGLEADAQLTRGQLNRGQAVRGGLPSQNYYLGFPEFYAGDYSDALKRFVRGGNTAFKIGPDERFLDSVCYWTMAGECHFHLGNYVEALEYYEQAINLFAIYAKSNWQDRLRSPTGDWDANLRIQRDNTAMQQANVNWYQPSRRSIIARIPNSFRTLFGNFDAARVLQEGGRLQNPEYRSVDLAEIMRCTSLAIYRRYHIKGTTSHIDPFTTRMLSAVSRLPLETPVFGKWNLMLRGLANMSAGKSGRAVKEISSALRFSSGMDHTLTPIGLTALAKIAFLEGGSNDALQLALEASVSAAYFEQFDLIEESLVLANTIHLSENRSTFPPLVPAIAWSSSRRTRMLQTSLLVELADGLVEAENVLDAIATLDKTKRSMSRTDLGRSPMGAKIRYLNATIRYIQGEDGSDELQKAMVQFEKSSLWLFRLRLVESAYSSGRISARQAEQIYQALLIDPTARHWMLEPMETMAYIASPHVGAMERLFEILVSRRNDEQSLEVAERIRRHRFYSSLPMSGRLLGLRWMLLSNSRKLNNVVKAQQAKTFANYPEVKSSIDQQNLIVSELNGLPVNPDEDTNAFVARRNLLSDLNKVSQFQEKFIRRLALRRHAADQVFPPKIDTSNISKSVKPRQLVISCLQTEAGYHLFMLTSETKRNLGVIRERDVRRKVAALFKSMGMNDANNSIDASILAGEEWKKPAANLKSLLFEQLHDDQWENFDELVVVPDGVLWYVPFEILQLGDDPKEYKSLGESVSVRFLPLLSMASLDSFDVLAATRTAVVPGKIHPKTEPELAVRAFEDLKVQFPNSVAFNRSTKIPSNLSSATWQSLLVWHDLKVDSRSSPYAISPFVVDRGRNGSTLGSWLRSPLIAPESVILPAYSSDVAAGLKSKSRGSEMFLTTCGLMASGVQRIMLSRWRTGGKINLDSSREFFVRSQEMPMVAALKATSEEIQKWDVSEEDEPRVKPSRSQTEPFKSEHPFFWAGNMVIDTNALAGPDAKPVADDLAQNVGDSGETETDPTKDEAADDVENKIPNVDPGAESAVPSGLTSEDMAEILKGGKTEGQDENAETDAEGSDSPSSPPNSNQGSGAKNPA